MAAIDLLAYVAEFAGIVLGAAILGIPAWLAVGLALLFHSLMVLTGSYGRYERIALVLSVALFTFVVLAFTVHPDPGAVLGGLTFAQPLGSRAYLDLVVATVGAVIMPWMLFYQQAATVDKGLRRGRPAAPRAPRRSSGPSRASCSWPRSWSPQRQPWPVRPAGSARPSARCRSGSRGSPAGALPSSSRWA